ncbi:unnamed protein product [Durusdinium trenchii]|uniref:Uncharacterized protein n=2 Tax=Durusdinium trenchii TaxID=1381693 RepID=A0ABP0HNL2_9DINO
MGRVLALSKKLGQWGIFSSIGIHVARYQGGDYLAQSGEPRSFDYWRSLAFASFGFYCGGVYHWVYGPIYTFLFLQRGVSALPVVLFDYAVTAQVLYFPPYYLLQDFIRSETPSCTRALEQCSAQRWEDFQALISVFLPLSWFNYSFVPSCWRGTFSGVAGLVWAIRLSNLRGIEV